MFQVSIPPSGFTLQAKRSPGRAQPRLGVESAARLLGFNSCRQECFVGSLETLVSGSSRLRICTGPSVKRQKRPKSQDPRTAHGSSARTQRTAHGSSFPQEAAAHTLEINILCKNSAVEP